MRNIFIIVEGYTELEFVKGVLGPHLMENGVTYVHPFTVTTNENLNKKGGGKTYAHLRKDLLKSVKYNPQKIVTTLFDYYAFPKDSPSREDCGRKLSVDEKISCLEEAIKNDIAPNNPFFFPYLQKHEFEALIFSSNSGFESNLPQISQETQIIINQFENPEEINDSAVTAPSKRIISLLPQYRKPLYGNVLALEVGITAMREKCPRFNNWIDNLIRIASE